MRIRRIDLAAFGKFSDASIEFGLRDQRVHIVYGPNEAGKSTLLRAIWAFFYGDLRKTKDDYQHAITNLRIGMTLESAGGEVVNWTRRGGGAQSLRDEADRPIAAIQMQKLLAEVSEHAFKNQFAINHDQLRHGSEQLYDQKGELGSALFAAASGITSITRVTSELNGEAEAIFTPAGRKKPFNEAVARLTILKKSLRESVVSTAKFNEFTRLRDESAQRVQSLQAKRTAGLDLERQLQRILTSIPKVMRLKELCAELATLPPAPALGANFGARRQSAGAAAVRCRALLADGETRLFALRDALANIAPDTAALELVPQLQLLEMAFGSYKKAQADRGRLEGELERSKREEAEVRRSLVGAHENAVAPTRHDLQHFSRQLMNYRSLAANRKSLERTVASLEAQLARLQLESSTASETKDLQPLKSAVVAGLLRGSIEQDLEKLNLQITQIDRSTQNELQSLGVTISAAEFLTTELPSLAKIADFDKRHSRIEKQIDEAERRAKDLSDSRDDLSQRLAALFGGGQVPTEEEIFQARTTRDQLWLEIRRNLNANPISAAKAPLLKGLEDTLAEKFDLAMRDADRLADLLRRESHRIAERLKLQADESVASAKLQATQDELTKLNVDRVELLADWKTFAASAPTNYRSPVELKEWQPSAVRLQDQLRKLGNLRAEAENVRDASMRLVNAIQSSSAQLGLSFNAHSLSDVLPAAQDALRALESAHNKHLAAKDQLSELSQQLADSQREAAVATTDADAIWRDLQQSLKHWNWSEVASLNEIERILPLMEELERLAAEMREKTHRITGIDRDASFFQAQLEAVAAKLSLPEHPQSTVEFMSAITARLSEARQQHEKASGLRTQIEELSHALEEHRQGLLLAESDLKALMLEAGANSVEALPLIENQAQHRSTLEAEKRAIESQLDVIKEGQTREAFTEACESTSLDTVKQQISELQSQATHLDIQIESEREELRTHDAWLRDNQTLEKVAAEELQVQETLSELRQMVRDHVKSRLASEVLLRAMRRYREENQGDLLKSGGEIFSRLTNGAYDGIRGDFNEEGVAELFAEKSSPPHVPLTQLSDGARDQLYLALRIATLKQHFAHHPPMPFIVDDIFVMFDEGRTLAALEELARLNETTQVIVFTHHAHVLELALDRLGEKCVTHELTPTGPFRTSAQIHQAHATPPSPTPFSPSRKRSTKKLASE